MADLNNLTDEELEAASQLLAQRRADAENVKREADLVSLKPLTDAGLGTAKKTSIADLIAALEANQNLIPMAKYPHANAALAGLKGLDDWLRGLQTVATPVVVPTPAAP